MDGMPFGSSDAVVIQKIIKNMKNGIISSDEAINKLLRQGMSFEEATQLVKE